MGGSEKGLFDASFLGELKLAAAGISRNGQRVAEVTRMTAQSALTSRLVKHKGAGSLFSLINGLLSEATLDDSVSIMPKTMIELAEKAFFSTVMSDIVAGRLVVREPLTLLRCNSIPEILALSTAREWHEVIEVLVRFAVLDSDAMEWLKWSGVEAPHWLGSRGEQRAGWAAHADFKSPRRKKQVSILEDLIREFGWPPLSIPSGGKSILKSACLDNHPVDFTSDSFDKCWKEMVKAALVMTCNHHIYSGKATQLDRTR